MSIAEPPGDGDGDDGRRKKPPSRYKNAPYRIGKGKPPPEHRFKKGGKPGPGRPRGSRNRSDLDKLFDERIIVGTDSRGRPIRKTLRRVINVRLLRAAADGDLRAIKIAKDVELKLETIKSQRGEPPPSAEELLKQAKEEEQKQALSAKLAAEMVQHLEMMAELKKRGLVGGPDAESGKWEWSEKALVVFETMNRGEI